MNGKICCSTPSKSVFVIPNKAFFKIHAAIQTLSNLVNFKSFGFTKIIPRVAEDRFEAVIKHSVNSARTLDLWSKVRSPTAEGLMHPIHFRPVEGTYIRIYT